MKPDLAKLGSRIEQATGPSDQMDQAISAAFDGDDKDSAVPAYTASVDACIALIQRVLPAWHWHVGHGPMGIVPYASMTQNTKSADPLHVEATAPTVPLALLGALFKALDVA